MVEMQRIALGAVLIMVLIVFGLRQGVVAQDGDDDAFTPVQQNLIAQVEASMADMQTWQSYKELRIERLDYEENVTITEGTTYVIAQRIESAITTIYDTNPLLSEEYNSDSLLTVQVQTDNRFGEDRQLSELYVLTVNVRYFDARLFVRGLYNGPPNEGLSEELASWQDISDDPEQYPVFQTANLYQFLPGQNPEAGLNPLLGVDFVTLMRRPLFRDMIVDIEALSDGDIILNGAGAEVATRQIEITLNPSLVLAAAFAGNPNRRALVQALVQPETEMKVILWLDTSTFRQVLAQYRLTIAGIPDPLHFGYGENDIEEDGNLSVRYVFESDILYADINIPMVVEPPEE